MVLSQCPTRVYPEDAWVAFVLFIYLFFLKLMYRSALLLLLSIDAWF